MKDFEKRKTYRVNTFDEDGAPMVVELRAGSLEEAFKQFASMFRDGTREALRVEEVSASSGAELDDALLAWSLAQNEAQDD